MVVIKEIPRRCKGFQKTAVSASKNLITQHQVHTVKLNVNKFFCGRQGYFGQCWAVLVFNCNFHCLIRPYWPSHVYNLIKDNELDLDYWNQNVRGRQGLRKGQSLILCTVGKLLCDSHETLQKNSVLGYFPPCLWLFNSIKWSQLVLIVGTQRGYLL